MANIGWGKCTMLTIPVETLLSNLGNDKNFKPELVALNTSFNWSFLLGPEMDAATYNRENLIKEMKQNGWKEIVNPVEGSVSVEASQGDKKEAKIEGGQNEDVRYNVNTYTASCQQRVYKGRTPAFVGNDGVVDGNYAAIIIPEDFEVPACFMPSTVVNVADNFSTEEGSVQTYNFDAVKLGDWNQVVLGNIVHEDGLEPKFCAIRKGTNEQGYNAPV